MMIDEKLFNKIASIVLMSVLVVLTFLIIRPILASTVFALILAFIFYPVYKKLRIKVKSNNLAALIVTAFILIIIIVPLIFLTPLLVKQTFEVYKYIQNENLVDAVQKIFPSVFTTQEISKDIAIAIHNFTSNIASDFLNNFSQILLNSPIILLHLLLILFVFFFGLRDGDKLISYIQSLSPLSKESEKKVFQQFKDITNSVIFGQIVVGIIQGIVTGIALFIFKIPNALVLTLLATLAGVLPIIGPALVWVPVDIYLFLSGRIGAGIGLLIYGLFIISWVDALIRPLIVSKKTKINSAIVLVSMIGGLFVFGILGLILGPLIIAYLILILEAYRNKKTESILIQKE